MPTAPFNVRPATRAARRLLQASLLASLAAVGTGATALITFEFDFGADNGVGFWEAGVGPTRQAAMTTAASSFAIMFATHFSNTATIQLSATATNAPASTNLASAFSQLTSDGSSGFTVNDIVRTKAKGGADANGAATDGGVNVNFGQPWQLDINAPVAGGGAGQYDFYSTIYHELPMRWASRR